MDAKDIDFDKLSNEDLNKLKSWLAFQENILDRLDEIIKLISEFTYFNRRP